MNHAHDVEDCYGSCLVKTDRWTGALQKKVARGLLEVTRF